ncbi:unnamed protein product [Callosobruchus maculatus]|uniref:Nucleolar protein 6 n=1 Tax=Callosobruchus maculatus TaxID=64391 RepID=A0A653DQG1_CALMS|nr:unnamed protein product [Callosobruchus maculatus]
MGMDNLESEQDSESGFSDNSLEVSVTKREAPKKRKYEDIPSNAAPTKKGKNELYRPPTVEELNALKETENLYNNNLFRLQIQELVAEVAIKNKRKRALSSWIDSFEKAVSNLPEYEFKLSSLQNIKEKTKSAADKLKRKLAKYKCSLETDQDLILKLSKPDMIQRFGLHEINSLPGPNLSTHLNLVMPKKCFLTKDFLNNRYLVKRYYYLLYIAESLKISGLSAEITLEFHGSNYLLPILLVRLNDCDKVCVYIYTTPAQDTFKYTRFVPDQNNLKLDVFKMGVEDDLLKEAPTVLYNSTLGHDVTLTENNEYVRSTLIEHTNVQEAIKLLYIWMSQREFNIGFGPLCEELIVYFITYLFSKKKINKYMSSYQVIRNFWSFIALTDLQEVGLSLSDFTEQQTFDSFRKYYDIVCLDRTGSYNFASFLSLDVYKTLKFECKTALKYLDENKNDNFQQLFLVKHPFFLQYDLVIDLTQHVSTDTEFDHSIEYKCSYAGFKGLLNVKYIHKVLMKALFTRVHSIVPRIEMDGDVLRRVHFGVKLNADKAFSLLEMGPHLQEFAAAAEFRKFWGHLASDRRFKDGSARVAVHFKKNTIMGKRSIVKKILDFVLIEKLGLRYGLLYNELEEVLVTKRMAACYPNGTNEETMLKIIRASDDLGKLLRGLKMSLKITGIQGLSHIFCFTEVAPTIPANYEVEEGTAVKMNNIVFKEDNLSCMPRYCADVESVLQLEHSSKWPSDLKALQFLKTAFYLEIAKMLQSEHKIVTHATPGFIDILYEGVVFRYLLHIPKELVLLKRSTTETEATSWKASADIELLERRLTVLPKIVGALKGVQAGQPSFGPGTCLAKRWLRAQLIDDHLFPDIVVDLVNAALYLNCTGEQSNTPQIAFFRFLKFFSDFDWELLPIVVNFNEDISGEEVTAVEAKLQQNRSQYPPLYIITPYDQGASVFTKSAPTKEVLFRVRQLARESLRFVSDSLDTGSPINVQQLFTPNLEGYNALIHLNPEMNSRRYEELVFDKVEDRIVIEKYRKLDDEKIPIVNFDPVKKYLDTLRRNYGKYATFFHNTHGGNVVGVLWNPNVHGKREFKVATVNAGRVVGDKIEFDYEAVLDDFYDIGKRIVKSISLQTDT